MQNLPSQHHAAAIVVAEHQLDDLLRGERFVDLYRVVCKAIRVSESSYSLKNMETFYMAKREGKVPPIVPQASMMPAGVVRLMEFGETGWTIVRP